MRIINIYCKTCSVAIAGPLAEIEQRYLQRGAGKLALRVNRFCVITDENRKRLIISLDEGDLKNHDDVNKFEGCCGSSGLDGLNKLCINGHEVATEFSDCLMSII